MGVMRMAMMVAGGAVLMAGVQGGAQQTALPTSNPFAQASALPFTAPPFDRIHDADYGPAFEAGMAEQRQEINAIANSAAAPTYSNTIVAMQKTGQLLERVQLAFSLVTQANTNPALQQTQMDFAPRLAAHEDATLLNGKLFARIKAVYDAQQGPAGEPLMPEQRRLVEVEYRRFVHAGALLNDADKAKLMELNKEESTLSNGFTRKVLAATKAGAYVTTDKAALAGLSDAEMAAAATAARTRSVEGYALPLQNTTQQPVLADLQARATRQAVYDNSWKRAERGGDTDTRATIARLAQLRAEKGRLLGFPTYAAWKISDQMAKTPDAAIAFMDALVPAATARAGREQKDIQDLITSQGKTFTVEPWDWEIYSEQVRKARYDLDETQVRPYFEINSVLENGVFYAANKLYGITFKERHDLPVWNPDVRVFEVSNADGSHLAVIYCDYWKRDNKAGGAWMSFLVRPSRLMGKAPVVYNVGNFTKPAAGQPGLISFADVITMFHEFGHALHGMFSTAEYARLGGTSVPRDFVEFPSQFNEHWATYPEVFAHFAKDYRTGEAMPAELAAKLKRAEDFNQGYLLTELLAAAELDMQWHTLAPGAPLEDPDTFERAALKRKAVDLEAVPPRYRSTYFAHIWGGGYAAGYYAYLWSEMLDDAAFQWFEEHGGLTRANGDRFRQMVLSRGYTEDLTAMFDGWLGGEPKIGPMLKQRGLVETK